MPTAKERERADAIDALRGMLTPGDTIHTVLRHVSSSGMYRAIDCYLLKPNQDGRDVDTLWLSRLVAKATGFGFDEKRQAVKAQGAGMDMGFHIVNSLSYTLFPAGMVCLGEHCPANDHSNGDRDYTPGHQHSRGSSGYALRHRWL